MSDEINKIIEEGVILKAASVLSCEVTDEDIRKINKFTLEPVTKDDVYVFKTIVGDNEIDDRNYEPFSLNALKDLKKLYIGKTVIKDHRRSADNQVARIFDTELVTENKITGEGEQFTKLITKQYMLKTDSNKDLIAEIKAGIKKEVSTGCRPKHAYCSICGTDNLKSYCSHWYGREYETKDGKKLCYFVLDGAKEAYELSLVAVPAQPRAGTTKTYGGKKMKEQDQQKPQEPQINKDEELESIVKSQRASLDSFLFINENKEDYINE